MKQARQKPNTPQKYGYAHKVIPIRKRIWQKVLIRWAVVLGIGVALIGLCLIAKPMFRNFPSRYRLSWMLTGEASGRKRIFFARPIATFSSCRMAYN